LIKAGSNILSAPLKSILNGFLNTTELPVFVENLNKTICNCLEFISSDFTEFSIIDKINDSLNVNFEGVHPFSNAFFANWVFSGGSIKSSYRLVPDGVVDLSNHSEVFEVSRSVVIWAHLFKIKVVFNKWLDFENWLDWFSKGHTNRWDA
jgi:hypothetical protein